MQIPDVLENLIYEELTDCISEELLTAINSDDITWITVKGNHIPIFEGQSIKEAIKNFFSNTNNKSKYNHKKYVHFHGAGKGTNPDYKQGKGYTTNCQSCIVVFMGRLQGLKIKAKPFDYKTATPDLKKFAKYPNIAFIDTNTGKHPQFINIPVTTPYDCKKWLEKNINDQGIYAFGHTNMLGQKHISTVYKNTNGNLIFYDPQDNNYSDEKYLDYVYFGDLNKTPKIFRIDDKKLDKNLINKISVPD